MNRLKKNDVEAYLESTFKVMERAMVTYRLKFFGILAGRCGSVVVRERDQDTKGPASGSRLDPGLRFSFFLIGTLSITERFRTGQAANCTDRDNFLLLIVARVWAQILCTLKYENTNKFVITNLIRW